MSGLQSVPRRRAPPRAPPAVHAACRRPTPTAARPCAPGFAPVASPARYPPSDAGSVRNVHRGNRMRGPGPMARPAGPGGRPAPPSPAPHTHAWGTHRARVVRQGARCRHGTLPARRNVRQIVPPMIVAQDRALAVGRATAGGSRGAGPAWVRRRRRPGRRTLRPRSRHGSCPRGRDWPGRRYRRRCSCVVRSAAGIARDVHSVGVRRPRVGGARLMDRGCASRPRPIVPHDGSAPVRGSPDPRSRHGSGALGPARPRCRSSSTASATRHGSPRAGT